MYRSASWNRFSDEYYSHSSPSPAPSSKPWHSLRLSSSFDHGHELPMNDPVSEMVKREKARVKFAETAVHVIPLLLLLCAVVLWFFSNSDIGLGGETMRGRIEALTVEGEIESEFDGTQKETLPILDDAFSDSSTLDDTSISKITRFK